MAAGIDGRNRDDSPSPDFCARLYRLVVVSWSPDSSRSRVSLRFGVGTFHSADAVSLISRICRRVCDWCPNVVRHGFFHALLRARRRDLIPCAISGIGIPFGLAPTIGTTSAGLKLTRRNSDLALLFLHQHRSGTWAVTILSGLVHFGVGCVRIWRCSRRIDTRI